MKLSGIGDLNWSNALRSQVDGNLSIPGCIMAEMNIDALLEAAIFLEKKTDDGELDKTRGGHKEAREFHKYAKTGPPPLDRRNSEKTDRDGSSSEDGGNARRRAIGSGTREVHNKLEKNRRAHLKECFENLKHQIPSLDDKKTSNLSILRSALRYIQILKRKEKEYEHESQQLALQKARSKERIDVLKKELSAMDVKVDLNHFIKSEVEKDSHSVSTATAHNESPIVSDDEDGEAKLKAPSASVAPASLTSSTSLSSRPAVASMASQPGYTSIQPRIIQTEPTLAMKSDPVHANRTDPVMSHFSKPLPSPLSLSSLPSPAALIPSVVANLSTTVTVPSTRIASIPTPVTTSQKMSTVPLPPVLLTPTTTVRPSNIAISLAAQPVSSALTVTTAPTAPTTARTPVTQILQQTLAQRALQQQIAQLQKLQNQYQQNGGPQVISMRGTGASGATATLKPLGNHIRQALTINHMNLQPSVVAPTASILAAAPSTLTSGQTVTITNPSQLAALAKLIPSTTVTTPQTSAAAAAVTPTAMTPVPMANVKHLLTTPVSQISHLMTSSGGQMSTIGHIVTQVPPRTTALQQPSNTLPTYTMPQIVTPGGSQMQPIQPVITSLSPIATPGQFLQPITVVSPGVLSGGFSQAQINSLNSTLIKQLGQLPILQQPFNLGQVVKPVVMVTVPNVAPTTTTAPAQAPAPLTPSVQVAVPMSNTGNS